MFVQGIALVLTTRMGIPPCIVNFNFHEESKGAILGPEVGILRVRTNPASRNIANQPDFGKPVEKRGRKATGLPALRL